MARAARKTGMELFWHIAGLAWSHPSTARLRGGITAACGVAAAIAFATYNAADPSLNAAGPGAPRNALGGIGAVVADIGVQSLGLAVGVAALLMVVLGLSRVTTVEPDASRLHIRLRALAGTGAVLALAGALALPAPPAAWPLAKGLGGFWGDALLHGFAGLIAWAHIPPATAVAGVILSAIALVALGYGVGMTRRDLAGAGEWLQSALQPQPKIQLKVAKAEKVEKPAKAPKREKLRETGIPAAALDPAPAAAIAGRDEGFDDEDDDALPSPAPQLKVRAPKPAPKESVREQRENQATFDIND